MNVERRAARPSWRAGVLAAVIAVVLAAADIGLCQWYAAQAVGALGFDPRHPYPVAVVLFADFSAEGVDDETRRRLGVAIEFYRAGHVQQILCVGGSRRDVPRSGARRMRDFLLAAGIDPQAVIAAEGSYDTRTNLQHIVAIARVRGWQSALLISAPLHLTRVRRLAASLPGAPRLGFAPYDYRRAYPSVSLLELVRQVHYEWLVGVLGRILGPERLTALARFLRHAGDGGLREALGLAGPPAWGAAPGADPGAGAPARRQCAQVVARRPREPDAHHAQRRRPAARRLRSTNRCFNGQPNQAGLAE